jgi:hypothetical protein
MASTYSGFDVLQDNNDGTVTAQASVTVHCYDVTHSAALSDVAADADGHVASGSVTPAAGTLLRFYFVRADGVCGYTELVTT